MSDEQTTPETPAEIEVGDIVQLRGIVTGKIGGGTGEHIAIKLLDNAGTDGADGEVHPAFNVAGKFVTKPVL